MIFRNVPLLLEAGVVVGALTGLCVGAMVSPLSVGMLTGLGLGVVVGAAAGIAMHRDDQRGARRGRQLDDIIGVTQGSLGAPPGSIPPGDLSGDASDDVAAWASEWLTPPPPDAR